MKEIALSKKEVLSVKQNNSSLDDSYNKLKVTIDKFVSRLDKKQTEMTATDYKMNILLEWARKVSEKTGIPLENL